MENYSVLMTVYQKDNPQYIRSSIDSMLNQTILTNDFVIVCDGRLTEPLDRLLEGYTLKHPELFHIIRLKENVGLGAALRKGVLLCKNKYIARMDADDIAEKKRCELELRKFEKQPELSIVGSFMREFEEDLDNPIRLKKVPLSCEEILSFSKRRNPFNHSTVMLKRDDVIAAGNYRRMRTNQDVELWVRMLNQGYLGENLNISLVNFRFDKDTYARRKDRKNIILLIKVWHVFYQKKYCSFLDFLYVLWMQLAIYFMPESFVRWCYDHLR